MSKDYRAIIADLDGTVHRGRLLIPGVNEVYSELSSKGVKWLFITNGATRLNEDLAEKISGMGLKVAPDQVINSGSALMREISKRGKRLRVMVVGTDRFAEGIEKAGATITDDPALTDVVAVALDPGFTYEKLKRAHIALQKGAIFWATNMDAAVPVETGLLPGAGSIAAAVSAAAGRGPDRVFGKPNTDMAEMAIENLKMDPASLLVVGDRLETDILFAHNAGIDSALVLTGAAKREDVQVFGIKPKYILESLGDISELFQG